MYSLAQNQTDENESASFVDRFLNEFHVGQLLWKCNAFKLKGVPIMELFRYVLCLVFSKESMYMQMKTGTFEEQFSKNTVYRFLNNSKTNWKRFTTLLSSCIIRDFLKPLTSDERKDVFIVDDTLYDRSRSRKTELLAKVFDHTSMKYKLGYRLLTLGWSDGNSFVPITHCLLSAADDKNLICDKHQCDGRSQASKRRKQAGRKGTDVMIELVQTAQRAGITAKYILFDTWFASPKTISALKEECNLNTIAMLKRNKTKYLYHNDATGEDKWLDIKEIYSRCKKRRGCSKYLLSVILGMKASDTRTIPVKVVYYRKKGQGTKKEWIALISTDTALSEEEIMTIYSKRWDIELYFKTCKSYLKLVKGTRSISYDALTAYVSIVMTRYMLLSVAKRRNEDDRTICELFYVMSAEMDDISFNQAMSIIQEVLMNATMEYFSVTESQANEFMNKFVSGLPKCMQKVLELDTLAS